jgi:hypothetical protein
MKIVIGTKACGLKLRTEMIHALYARNPGFFYGMPHDLWFLKDDGPESEAEFRKLFPEAVVGEAEVFFLKDADPALRTDPWLVAQVCVALPTVVKDDYRGGVKIVDVPDGVRWYIRADEDGSEKVHEEHRIWE